MTIPVRSTIVKTRDLTTEPVCPCLARRIEVKYPAPFNNHIRGIDRAFTIKGPIHGIRLTKPANPAKALVIIPTSAANAVTRRTSRPAANPKTTTIDTIPSPIRVLR